jgi:hypothetical protein
MDTAILSVSAGFIGSLIGGVSTFAASWVTQHKLLGTQTRIPCRTTPKALFRIHH